MTAIVDGQPVTDGSGFLFLYFATNLCAGLHEIFSGYGRERRRGKRRDKEEEVVKHPEKESVLDLSSTRVEMHGIRTAIF